MELTEFADLRELFRVQAGSLFGAPFGDAVTSRTETIRIPLPRVDISAGEYRPPKIARELSTMHLWKYSSRGALALFTMTTLTGFVGSCDGVDDTSGGPPAEEIPDAGPVSPTEPDAGSGMTADAGPTGGMNVDAGENGDPGNGDPGNGAGGGQDGDPDPTVGDACCPAGYALSSFGSSALRNLSPFGVDPEIAEACQANPVAQSIYLCLDSDQDGVRDESDPDDVIRQKRIQYRTQLDQLNMANACFRTCLIRDNGLVDEQPLLDL